MKEVLESIKNRIAWFEKQEGKLTTVDKEAIELNLKHFDDELERYMLLHLAISKK